MKSVYRIATAAIMLVMLSGCGLFWPPGGGHGGPGGDHGGPSDGPAPGGHDGPH